jgi:uncharacterized protein with FMN-binding domain
MTTTDSRSAQWLKSNLAAIGSAAVLTVYATGWTKTKAAADLLEEQSARRLPPRRPAATVAMGQVDGTAMPRSAESPDASNSPPETESSAPTPANAAPATDASRPVAANEGAAQGGAASAARRDDTPAPRSTAPDAASNAQPSAPSPSNGSPSAPSLPNALPAPAVVASTVPPPEVATKVAAPTPAPVVKAAQLPPQTPSVAVPNSSDTRPPERELATTAIATVPASSAGATRADPNAPVRYKDGVYSGWGSSRHGDIEAYVEIKNGRITSAFISECLTQYSCSWIAKLPGWVVREQSAETDYISGATQSSNAFYYAVVAALNKAR